ncbi:MAG TPA: hypothetical protein VLG27_01910 [Candidatus Saccharimonadia bacterium]|nr:hypothetical protein [Candidatus Saccharimonadia bacterium]
MAAKNTKPTLITDLRPGAQKPDYSKQLKKFVSQNARLVAGAAVLILVVLVVLLINHGSGTKGGAGQKQIDDTVAKVSKLFLVPQGEQPTLAVINDASKYKNVAFFKNAQNGDRLLVYAQAREAILYRPSINKIIAVAPLNPGTAPTTSP